MANPIKIRIDGDDIFCRTKHKKNGRTVFWHCEKPFAIAFKGDTPIGMADEDGDIVGVDKLESIKIASYHYETPPATVIATPDATTGPISFKYSVAAKKNTDTVLIEDPEIIIDP